MIGSGVYFWRSQVEAADARQEAAERFATAWAERDHEAMWRALTPRARAANPERRFAAAYANAERAAGVRAVEIAAVRDERDGRVAVPVAIRTAVSGTGEDAGIDWDYSLRLPGLRRDEAVVRRSGPPPREASVLAVGGAPLQPSALKDGLERMYADRLTGRAPARLLFGDRVVARTRAVRGRSVKTTIEPGLSRAASAALGDRLGGIAVIRPRAGAARAVVGRAVSAPQPPGSVFKILTAAAALDKRIVRP